MDSTEASFNNLSMGSNEYQTVRFEQPDDDYENDEFENTPGFAKESLTSNYLLEFN